MQTSDVIRRVLAGAAMATMISLPFAGAAHAQTDTDTDGGGTDTDGAGATTTSTTTDTANTATTLSSGLGSRLAETGDEWTVPGVIAGAGLALAFSARALARHHG